MWKNDTQNRYIWRTSLVQLRPKLQTWAFGGLKAEDGLLRLVSQGTTEDGEGVEIEIHPEKGEVKITVPNGGGTNTLGLLRLQCCRLPGAASTVGPTIDGSGVRPRTPLPWTERNFNKDA